MFSTSPTPVHLLDLAPEVLAEIVLHLDPVDASNLAQTCKTLSSWLYGKSNGHLWKLMFLQLFDPLDSAARPGYKFASTSTEGARRGRLTSSGSGKGKCAVSTGDQAARDRSVSNDTVDYMQLVKDRCRARGIVNTPHSDKKAKHRADTIRTLHEIYLSADNRVLGTSKNAALLSSLLSSRTSLTDWLSVPPAPVASSSSASSSVRSSRSPVTRSMASSPQAGETETDTDTGISPIDDPYTRARMNQLAMAGITHQEISWFSYKSGQRHRETVYRGSSFDQDNIFGPFLKRDDGRLKIDWNLLNAIAQVMALNVRSAWHQWAEPDEMDILPYGFERAVFWKQPGPGRDWAGVEGRWNYIYAFIDYNDYFAFNFASTTLPNLRPMTLEGISEAVGGVNSLRLRLMEDDEEFVEGRPIRRRARQPRNRAHSSGHISDHDDADRIKTGQDDEDSSDDEDDDEAENTLYPPLRFVGESTGPQGSTFRGTVKILEDGNRHWTFIIRYSGQDRWQTECIELGGRGIYGIWSDVLHEELSPCGPVWYFRE